MKENKISYLRPLINFFLLGILIFTISRLILCWIFEDRVFAVENPLQLLINGFKFDLIVLSYLSFIPLLLLTFFPNKSIPILQKIISIYFSIFLFLFIIFESCTPEFIDQYDTRPNSLFLEYLIYPKEIFNMLFRARPVMTLFVVLGAIIIICLLYQYSSKIFKVSISPYTTKLILFPFIGFLLFWGARGSLTSKRPINASNAVFCNDQMVNSLSLNSFFSISQATYSKRHEIDPIKLYGTMDESEAFERVKKYINSDFDESNTSPFSHKILKDSTIHTKYNVVIFLQESLGAEYVGILGGLPLTPHFDKLAAEGVLFTNLYCTGTRSVRGIEAVVTGFLPTPAESVVKLPKSQTGFYTIAQSFRDNGYDTSFIYGGMANFDNMGAFFNGNGFENIIDEVVFDADPVNQFSLKGVWGYSDEDLVVKANDYFKNLDSDKPFFSLMFSTSNHEPFEFPDDRIELYEEPQNTLNNAIKYADYAIGRFFDLAQHEEYYKNTIFLIVADHNTRTYGQALVPIDKFHIPALLIGPNIPKNVRNNLLCSQIDLPSTLVAQSGIDGNVPLFGNNLLGYLPISERAIMQFHDITAFRKKEDVIILQPHQSPIQFKIDKQNKLTQTNVNPELAKDALAHILTSYYLYKNKQYR